MIERAVTISAGIESLTKKGKFRMSYCMGKGGRGALSLSHAHCTSGTCTSFSFLFVVHSLHMADGTTVITIIGLGEGHVVGQGEPSLGIC